MGADKLAKNTPNLPKPDEKRLDWGFVVRTLQQLKDVPETARVTRILCQKKKKKKSEFALKPNICISDSFVLLEQ